MLNFYLTMAMYHYLRELRQRIAAVSFFDAKMIDAALPEQGEYKRIRTENLDWIVQQGDEYAGFAVRFRPFLVHVAPKRSWWLRWPE
jgi:hypothetical protein